MRLATCHRPNRPRPSAQLVDDLRRNDLAAYARHAVPPALHARMERAWREGRTIWPLTELPLDDRLPGFITVLSAPGAEKSLLAAYGRQFAGADARAALGRGDAGPVRRAVRAAAPTSTARRNATTTSS